MSSDLQLRKQQLSQAAPDLQAHRLPIVVEADIGATAERGGCPYILRQYEINLEDALQRLDPFGIAGIDGEDTATAAAQGLAGEGVMSCRYFADDLDRQRPIWAFSKPDFGALQPMANKVDVVLTDCCAHDREPAAST
jgi:hypothetical protein